MRGLFLYIQVSALNSERQPLAGLVTPRIQVTGFLLRVLSMYNQKVNWKQI